MLIENNLGLFALDLVKLHIVPDRGLGGLISLQLFLVVSGLIKSV